MKVRVLGSGAWEGIPAPFCACRVCGLALKDPRSKNNRTRPEFLFEGQGGKFLVEISPDIRRQSTQFRLPPITDFLISHWHFDHMYGLHELLSWTKRQAKKPVLHCSAKTKVKLDREFSYIPFTVNVLQPLKSFVLFGITITPLPVYHMFDQDDETSPAHLENAYGYLFEQNDTRAAYLGDYYRIPQVVLRKIQAVDVLIADGTYLLTNKYKGLKLNHMHGDDILRFTTSTQAKKIYYHSISHLTNHTHKELQKALPASHFISYDGMRLI